MNNSTTGMKTAAALRKKSIRAHISHFDDDLSDDEFNVYTSN